MSKLDDIAGPRNPSTDASGPGCMAQGPEGVSGTTTAPAAVHLSLAGLRDAARARRSTITGAQS
jgi:hypothetical protein